MFPIPAPLLPIILALLASFHSHAMSSPDGDRQLVRDIIRIRAEARLIQARAVDEVMRTLPTDIRLLMLMEDDCHGCRAWRCRLRRGRSWPYTGRRRRGWRLRFDGEGRR